MNCAGVFVGAFLIPFVVLSRGIWLSTIFALCDVAEPIIIAGLIARYFGVDFALDQLRKVFGFLGAAIAGIIPSSLAGAVDGLRSLMKYVSPWPPSPTARMQPCGGWGGRRPIRVQCVRFDEGARDGIRTRHLPHDCRGPWRLSYGVVGWQERGPISIHLAGRVNGQSHGVDLEAGSMAVFVKSFGCRPHEMRGPQSPRRLTNGASVIRAVTATLAAKSHGGSPCQALPAGS